MTSLGIIGAARESVGQEIRASMGRDADQIVVQPLARAPKKRRADVRPEVRPLGAKRPSKRAAWTSCGSAVLKLAGETPVSPGRSRSASTRR